MDNAMHKILGPYPKLMGPLTTWKKKVMTMILILKIVVSMAE